MVTKKIFNRALGRMPQSYIQPFLGLVLNVVLTNHAREQAFRHGMQIVPPQKITIKEEEIVEMEVFNGKVIKLVARFNYNSFKDLVLVFIPEEINAIVKTLWLNDKNDNHETLDLNRIRRGDRG